MELLLLIMEVVYHPETGERCRVPMPNEDVFPYVHLEEGAFGFWGGRIGVDDEEPATNLCRKGLPAVTKNCRDEWF